MWRGVRCVPTDAKCDGSRATELACSGARVASKTMVLLEAYCKQLEPLVHAVYLLRVWLHARVELEPQPVALKHEPHEP